MSNDKNKEAKLLALGYMTVAKLPKRKTISVVTITAMHTHSQEHYDEMIALHKRLNDVKAKCKKRNIRFSITAFATEAVKKALTELEQAVN
jgi:hypothetical protein